MVVALLFVVCKAQGNAGCPAIHGLAISHCDDLLKEILRALPRCMKHRRPLSPGP